MYGHGDRADPAAQLVSRENTPAPWTCEAGNDRRHQAMVVLQRHHRPSRNRQKVLGAQVHAPAPMHPAVCLGTSQEDQGFRQRRPDRKHRAVVFCEIREEGGNVSAADMWIEKQSTQRDRRNLLGQGGTSKQRAGKALGNRIGDGSADQSHLADELDPFFILVFKLEYKAKYIARIDEANNYDISRVRNLVVEDRLADARSYELNRRAFWGAVHQFRLAGSTRQRPDLPSG